MEVSAGIRQAFVRLADKLDDETDQIGDFLKAFIGQQEDLLLGQRKLLAAMQEALGDENPAAAGETDDGKCMGIEQAYMQVDAE